MCLSILKCVVCEIEISGVCVLLVVNEQTDIGSYRGEKYVHRVNLQKHVWIYAISFGTTCGCCTLAITWIPMCSAGSAHTETRKRFQLDRPIPEWAFKKLAQTDMSMIRDLFVLKCFVYANLKSYVNPFWTMHIMFV